MKECFWVPESGCMPWRHQLHIWTIPKHTPAPYHAPVSTEKKPKRTGWAGAGTSCDEFLISANGEGSDVRAQRAAIRAGTGFVHTKNISKSPVYVIWHLGFLKPIYPWNIYILSTQLRQKNWNHCFIQQYQYWISISMNNNPIINSCSCNYVTARSCFCL